MLIICLKIYFARILDVSLGTVRTILLVKNKTLISTLIAFIEVIIWFIVAKEALNINSDSIVIPIAYAAGYATGTFTGSKLANKYIDNFIMVNIITVKDLNILKKYNYGITSISLENNNHMYLVETKKSNYEKLIKLIKSIDKNAFVIVTETKSITNGYIK